MIGTHWRTLAGTAVIVLSTIVAYWPCLRGPFLFDDVLLVEECPAIHASDGLTRLWVDAEMPNYEPLTYSVFWFGWQLWGEQTIGYHLLNVGLHVLACLLLWKLLERLKIPGAWLAALLFALHPVNVQSVAYIFQIRNTLSTALAFAALLCWLRFERKCRPRWYAAALALFVLAMLSKTAVVMLPVLILGVGWWQTKQVGLRDLKRVAPFFAVAMLLGLTEVWFQNHRAIGEWNVRDDGLVARTLGAASAVCFYARSAVAPIDLMFIHPRWQIDPASALWYLPLAGLVLLAGILWRMRHTWGRPGLAALGWFVFALLPVLGFLNIAFMRYSFVADHWQYLALPAPLALVIGLGAHFADQARGWQKRVLQGLAALAIVGFGLLTWRHAALFGDPEQLWQNNYAKNPTSPMVCFSLGAELGKRGAHDEALQQYREALALDSTFSEAHVNAGATFLLQGDPEAAHRHLTLALEQKAESPRVRLNLAGALVRLGRAAEAIPIYEWLLATSRRFQSPAELGLGVACLHVGDTARATKLLDRAVHEQPTDVPTLKLLGDARARQGQLKEAIDCYRRALAADPAQAGAHVGLGNVAAQQGRAEEATKEFQRALELQPNSAAAHGAWGELLARQGHPAKAREHFTEALRLDPRCVEALAALGDLALADGQADQAIEHYSRAVDLRPRQVELRKTLGDVLLARGRAKDALEHYRAALEAQPRSAALLGRVAWLLATSAEPACRNGAEAVYLAERLCKLAGERHPVALDTLAAAYAETGRYADAVRTELRAIDTARRAGQESLARDMGERLALYERGQPFRAR